jgi:hypothetical protein
MSIFLPMCAAFELNSRLIRPGRMVGVWRSAGAASLVWAGFARREILGWWKKKGGELVDIPAHRFAERSDFDRQLRWDDVRPGQVIRGVFDPHEGKPLVRVVTRPSMPEEQVRFQHGRMPVIEAPLFNSAPVPISLEPDKEPEQGELF